MSNPTVWFERNEQGEALEVEGRFAEARALYEQNVREGCTTTFTFERLAALYGRDGRTKDEVEMLGRAVALEKDRGASARLVRLKERLQRAELRLARGGVRGVPTTGAGDLPVSVRRRGTKEEKGCLGSVVLAAALATVAAVSLAAGWGG